MREIRHAQETPLRLTFKMSHASYLGLSKAGRANAKRWLWRLVGHFWKNPHGWQGSALDYVREYWPEELLLLRIIEGDRRFLRAKWWWIKAVCLTLP